MERAPRKRRRRANIEPLESRVLMSTGELIRNGSFEGPSVAADWIAAGSVHADSAFTNPHSGLGYAYLANADGSAGNSINGSVYQQLTIPAGATSGAVVLSFWTKISTSETTTTAQNDLLTVKVMDASGTNVLQNVATLSNLNSSSSYVRRSYTLSNSLIGSTVRIVFSASTNATLATTFRVDDVGLATRPADLSKRVVGYLPNYESSTFFSRLDYNLFTHINYFSISVNADGMLSSGGVTDTKMADVVTKAHAKGVGVSITVGPQSFATVAADPALRAAFAANVKAYIQARNLDGVDIDWEPPATGANQANYALLIDDLYKQLSPAGLKITAATNPWTKEIPVAATNEMDWVNVMCYDFDFANHSTYAAATDGMKQWSDYGVAKDKLVMGTPFYGRYGTSWSDTHSQTYGTILTNYKNAHSGAYPTPDTDSYVYVDSSNVSHTVYFNGVTTIEKKMAYVRDNGYGGAMIWELAQDHWDASGKYDQYSLLPAINSMLRPPTWVTPMSGSMFDYVANTFYAAGGGNVMLSGSAWASNPNVSLAIASGATVTATMSQRLASLAIAAGGTLDLKNQSLIVDYASGGVVSPMGTWTGASYAGIAGMIAAGRIVSSVTPPSGATMAIGVAEASQALGLSGSQTRLFAGQTADASSVLVKYTYAGDTNLDGRINVDDYGRVDSAVAIGLTGWLNGDFNYDGKVNVDDYGIIDLNVGVQGPAL
jgi:GH18 family chitinase